MEEATVGFVSVFCWSYRLLCRPPSPSGRFPKIQPLSRKEARIPIDRVSKQELWNEKGPPRHKRFCKLCQASCNETRTFYNQVNFRARYSRPGNKINLPRCTVCNNCFEAHGHLLRHFNRAAQKKVFSEQNFYILFHSCNLFSSVFLEWNTKTVWRKGTLYWKTLGWRLSYMKKETWTRCSL